MTDGDYYCIISGQIPVFTLLPVTLQTFFGLLNSPEHCGEASCHVPSGAYLGTIANKTEQKLSHLWQNDGFAAALPFSWYI